MSLNLVKKNSSSPFQLQKSMVNQSGRGDVYESGGFNPAAIYNNDAANAAVESLGKVIGAALSSRTAGDENASDKAQLSRLENRSKRLVEKSNNSEGEKRERIEKRLGNIGTKIQDTSARIKKYEESINPTFKSSLLENLAKEEAARKVAQEKEAEKAKEAKETKETLGILNKSFSGFWKR